jgi:hypothetical protein
LKRLLKPFHKPQKDKTPTIADEGLLFWWAHQDLNLGPKDSGLCSFHYSLDYAFIILIAQLRWVPSSLYTFNSTFTLKLGSALACAAFDCI